MRTFIAVISLIIMKHFNILDYDVADGWIAFFVGAGIAFAIGQDIKELWRKG